MKEKRVIPIELRPDMQVDELVEEMGKSGVFGAGRVAKAVKIYHEMLKVGSTVFMGIGGAMIPGGLRRVFVQTINEGLVDVLVTTGANVTHDLIEAFGGYHAQGEFLPDDVKLREQGISRIFDVYVPQRVFELFEDRIQPMFAEISGEGARMSSAELLRRIGSRLEDENSFLKAAAKKNVPVFCPAIADSILGIQAWLYSQERELCIDCLRDVREMVELASNSKKPGAIFLGGGVAKNFIFQSMLLAPRSFEYAIQITMDRPEHGGLSGAALEEAKSWGKLAPNAKAVSVIGDATIIFTMMVASMLKRKKNL